MFKTISAMTAILATPALAEVPRVVTDIAPVHSLVAQVMAGVGTPDLIVQPGVDVHDLALRPSDAAQIEQAEVVIWVGSEMTPWLADPLDALSSSASTLTLLDVAGWTPVMHEDGDVDAHAWLDPEVAIFWLQSIRDTLTATDPDNAAAYAANTDRYITEVIALQSQITAQFAQDAPQGFIVPHDAFAYFEGRFGVAAASTISDHHDHDPGPAHLQELQALAQDGSVDCVFYETGGSDSVARLVAEGSDAEVASLDAISMGAAPGPALYGELLTRIAARLTTCTDD